MKEWVPIWGFWLQLRRLKPRKVSRRFYMCGSHCESWRWRVRPWSCWLDLSWTIIWFSQHDSDPKHTSRLWKSYSIRARRRVMGWWVTWPGVLSVWGDDSLKRVSFLIESPGLSQSRINLRQKEGRIFNSAMSNVCQYASVQMCFWNQWEISCRKHKVDAWTSVDA